MTPPAAQPTRGPTVVARRVLGRRLIEYDIDSRVLRRVTSLRVVLPADYARADTRFPVLYLLHGGGDDYRSWTDKGEVLDATEDAPLIVVMPDGGRGGFYSDWVGPSRWGRTDWERFHINELLPWMDRTFRTEARRAGRALAGLSMGGFGAMSYAARHPDLFVAAASFSGALDNSLYRFIFDTAVRRDGGAPGAIWGDRRANLMRWRAHNPVDIAANLRGMALVLRTGTGIPGELTPHARPDPIEALVFHESLRMHHTLRRLGIEHEWYHGRGCHDWPYWARDLRATLPLLHKVFTDPPARPQALSYTSAEADYRVDGWHVSLFRKQPEFTTLSTTSSGFELAGGGTATVTTAPNYEPGHRYRLTVGERTVALQADPAGRLAVSLRLGPTGRYRQPTTTVTIDREPS